ncbi:DUF2987 domain-containing protein [Aestuariibacter sp. AA17]|uniref:DUF2987 domain-containing protein n=1 Tax=Fluctibacter corallii TaxID=2984329 RepID=A0ABT3A6K0_9ALTE|nr:DUF2987 domain-containing protein [Aestuariibacter sp. AA17]MCV2884218.1 DUF2987 domain-containing protein [Aestuariibacter sp. AA17]
MIKPLLAASLVFTSTFSFADPLALEYKTFYSHVKKIDDEDTNALQFSFGFKHIHENRLCDVKSALIKTQKQDIPLTVTSENRFTVPNEKALKLADALVIIELDDQDNQCDMSVQLETKPEWLKQNYTQDELMQLFSQYENFFDDIGGFMSFLLPSVTGLQFTFNDDVAVEGMKTRFTEGELSSVKEVSFNALPKRITAITKQDDDK